MSHMTFIQKKKILDDHFLCNSIYHFQNFEQEREILPTTKEKEKRRKKKMI